jgi:uncharacterized membrane protein (UPF0127 family)
LGGRQETADLAKIKACRGPGPPWRRAGINLRIAFAGQIQHFCGMQHRFGLALAMGLGGMLLLMSGCENRKSAPGSPAPRPATNSFHLSQAQPRLRTIKLYVGPHEITAEVALTRTEVATGMMFRKTMEENEGMLFVFAFPHRASFYMKNTLLPLSVAYIDEEGNILEIHDLKPLDETPVEARSDQVQYVLEMKQDWFKRHGITTGAYLRTEKGSLSETFFPQR